MTLPRVTIVVTTYVPESKAYLDLCIRSIANLDYPKDRLQLILVGKKDFAPLYDNVLTVYPDTHYLADRNLGEHFFTPTSLNYGALFMNDDSDYIMDLNDDTIMTRDSLKNMVQAAEDFGRKVAINPISQCEPLLYDFYHTSGQSPWGADHKPQYMRMDSVEGRQLEFMNMKSQGHGSAPIDFLCMYATLIPAQAWRTIKNGTTADAIGFDENFKTGQDDIDYSKRLSANGFGLAICADAIVWHFGGVNSSNTVSSDLRRENVKYFIKKWRCYPPLVTKEQIEQDYGFTVENIDQAV